MRKRKVLFLCTGNSCRSQMAEAIVNSRLSEGWQGFSAGTHPGKSIHPNALAALEEIGIRHAGNPKSVQTFQDVDLDLVITVCDDAAEECPFWIGKGKVIHQSFPDPARTGLMEDFRSVRDAIEREIITILEDHED